MYKTLIITSVCVLAMSACSGGNQGAQPAPGPTSGATQPGPASTAPRSEPSGSYDPNAGEGPPEEMPSWKASDGPVTFVCDNGPQGVTYEFSLPTDENHEAIKKVEALRKEAKLTGKPSYVMVKIDATHGVSSNSGALYKVEWATANQESRETDDVSDMLGKWRSEAVPDINKPGVTTLYNKFIQLGNELMKTTPNRGAKGYELHVVDGQQGPIDSMVAPTVLPSGFESVPCVPKKR
ncbi:hypothetical protein CGZ93_17730 [Enemella dayhoffiae]|uniref:Lipoprotein n=1 Tax=Enemella dayhoffiae TaxID=2016507 RepID=A0A255GM08_9ACTN|nr:hypothetical protein [Enemella dayhoffiae]OYO16601.1 hypothetical protein CGZ93_17730 [Enemella dayhoffiae]